MRSSLIAAGGAFLAAAVLFGGATPATATADRDRWDESWSNWAQHYPERCGLGLNDDTTYHHVTAQGVFAGTRDADACRGDRRGDVNAEDDAWSGIGD